ncbi:MAG: glycosyl hydrolase [Candidatus Curtissbacteria bacterium]
MKQRHLFQHNLMMHTEKINRLLKFICPVIFVVTGLLLFTECNNNVAFPQQSLLEEGFINPATENRPLALWPWLNGFVDTTKLVYELEQMKDKGMRGAVIWDIGALADPDKMIPEGPPFLDDQSLEYISLAIKTAGKLGLDLGMVASSSWNAGGPWVDAAEASMQLLSTSQVVEGPGLRRMIIKEPENSLSKMNRHSLITSMAVPYSAAKIIGEIEQAILLDDFTSQEKYIEWKVPKGKWEILSFYMSNTGQNLVVPSPNSNGLIIDHLSEKATKDHFDSMLVKLKRVSTSDNHLKFLMLDSYEVWSMKDWSPRLIEEFMGRYAYDPKPFLPLLTGYSTTDSIRDQRFLGDYNRLVSDMMVENHFGQSVDIANEYGIEMLTEAGHGGYPRVDPLKALGHSHIPMGEFWNRRRFWVTKEAASAAHIYGKKVVASESLTGWNNWQHGPADFKQLIDIAFCEGLNQVVFHTFAHNPEVAGKPGFVYHAGEHINVNTTWWEMARPFMDYIARSSYMLRQGNFVGDVCLYYGDQAPNLVPPKRIDPNITPIFNDQQCLHCGKPKPVNPGDLSGYDYDYMNADIITTVMKVEGGKLVLPSGQSYRMMVLPDREDISLEVLRRLEKLVYEGAVIIGRKPERSTSLKNFPDCDKEVQSIADKMWGTSDGKTIFSNNYGKGTVYWGKPPIQVLRELNIDPDFEVRGTEHSQHHIDYIHRQTKTEEIYFVTNSSQAEERVTCTFRVKTNMVPELWDAETGMIQRNVAYSKVENRISIDLVLDPLSSRFVVFKEQSTGENDDALTQDLQFGFSKSNVATKIDLTHDWQVSFDPKFGGPETYHMTELTSWADIALDRIKYYSGTATYTREFTIKEEALSTETQVYVAFEDIQEIARIFVNGKDCGIIWTPPYRTNITRHIKPGKNEISVQATNTWNNRIIGDLRNPQEKTFTSTNAKYKFKENSSLLKSGLLGHASILFTR